MTPSADEISRLCQLVNELSGIQWDATKGYLIETRLVPLLKAFGFANFRQLVEGVRRGHNPDLRRAFIDAITTRETLFFRDETPFQALREKLLPEIIAAKRRPGQSRRLRLWSAACSSGQEPYSLAIQLLEHFPALAAWDVRIFATDISRDILQRAASGSYSQLEVNRGLPASLLVKYFERRGLSWVVKDAVRRLVQFEELNLIRPWRGVSPSDIVFMRNVLIYFDVPTKKEILGRIRQVMRPDGYLFLGSAETTMNIDPTFTRVPLGQSSAYRIGAA